MACKVHPDRHSVAICMTCRTELCEECRNVGADGRSYCAEHLSQAAAAPPRPTAAPPQVETPAATTGPPPPPQLEMPPRGAAPAQAAVSGESTVLAAFCYFCWVLPPLSFVLPVIPLASSNYKASRYMRYHAYNGLFWGLGVIVVAAVLHFVGRLAGVMPFVGPALSPAFGMLTTKLVPLAALVASVIFAINANNRGRVRIPLISEWADKSAG